MTPTLEVSIAFSPSTERETGLAPAARVADEATISSAPAQKHLTGWGVFPIRKVLAGTLILAGLGVIGYAVLASETDEEEIVRQLMTLADAVGVREGENPLFRRARLGGVFENVLVDTVSVQVPDFGLPRNGREEVLILATRAGTYFESGTVDLDDIEIDREGSRPRAAVRAVATLTSVRGSVRRDTRTVQFGFVLHDGDWLVDRIAVQSAAAQPEQ